MFNSRIKLFIIFLVVAALSVQADLSSLQPRTVAISPASITASQGHDFSIDVIAYPFIERASNARLNNYKLLIYYDPNYLRFVSIENAVEGLTIDSNNIASGSIEFGASKPFGAFYQLQPTTLARITLVPVKNGQSDITFQSLTIVNSLGESGFNAPLITTLQSASVSVGDSVDGGDGSCTPTCRGKTCGPDGCGNVCGQCQEGQQCQNNNCVCIPNCEGRECGTDDCSGSCGSCSPGTFCQSNERTSSCVPGAVLPEVSATKQLQKPQSEADTWSKPLQISLGIALIILALVIYLIYRKKSSSPLNPI